jgi:hypothetical protein
MRNSILIGGGLVVVCFGLTLLEKQNRNDVEPELVPNQETQEDVSEEINRFNRLGVQKRLVEKRIESSRRIAQDLIAHRLTLLEAADQLQSLDIQSAPICRAIYESAFPNVNPGRTEKERYCRRAISLVDSELLIDPVKCAAVLRELNQELRFNFPNGSRPTPPQNGGI